MKRGFTAARCSEGVVARGQSPERGVFWVSQAVGTGRGVGGRSAKLSELGRLPAGTCGGGAPFPVAHSWPARRPARVGR